MQKQNDKLLVFFNGWGMDNGIVSHLSTEGYDYIYFNNYLSLNKLKINNFNNYKNKTLIAWSFGVFMAAYYLQEYKFDISIAINGTLEPINDEFGISPTIFQATLASMDKDNLINFYKRCCVKQNIFQNFMKNKPQRELSEQIAELSYLGNISQKNSNLNNIFNLAYIGRNDRIFPAENQRNFWQDKVRIIETDKPHYPFDGITSWKEFIDKHQ